MDIKHIVIPAGGAKGFFFYGALQHLNRCGFWDYKNIQNIYGTSIGCFVGVLIALYIREKKSRDWLSLLLDVGKIKIKLTYQKEKSYIKCFLI